MDEILEERQFPITLLKLWPRLQRICYCSAHTLHTHTTRAITDFEQNCRRHNLADETELPKQSISPALFTYEEMENNDYLVLYGDRRVERNASEPRRAGPFRWPPKSLWPAWRGDVA